MDRRDVDHLPARVAEAVRALGGVSACRVRFHEEGLRLSGVIHVATEDGHLGATRVQAVRDAARAVHWRIDAVAVMPEPGGDAAPAPGVR